MPNLILADLRSEITANVQTALREDLGSGDIESVKPVPAGDVLPGEDQPRWLPPGENRPVLPCGRVERIETDGGLVTGWLHYTDGC